MRISQKAAFLCFSALFTIFASCKKEPVNAVPDTIPFEPAAEIVPETHRWFTFTKNGFEETTIPAHSPDYPLRPWTQAPRISGTLSGTDTGYLLVNRRGLIQLRDTDEPRLIPDYRFFSGTTADSLLTGSGNPVFKLYINTLFEEKVDLSTAATGNIPVMVQYNPETSLYYPLIQKADLKLPETAQVTALASDGSQWYFSAKESSESQTQFTYLAMPAGDFFDPRNVTEISDEAFHGLWNKHPLTAAPGRLKELLQVIPDSIPFSVSVSDYSQSWRVSTPEVYFQGAEEADDDGEYLTAQAQMGKSWTLVLFSDGTCYFSGALPKKHILNNGRPVYFRLPALPQGIGYTDFALCGSKLYAAWEEATFFNTGKAGFLEVDLAKVLY